MESFEQPLCSVNWMNEVAPDNNMATDVVCNWNCMVSPPCTIKRVTHLQDFTSLSRQCKTFVQAVSNTCDISNGQLPRHCIKGEAISIKISEEEYLVGLESCKNHLHSRIILTKRSKPLKASELRAKLSSVWDSIGKCGLTSLGRGYFEFSFSLVEAMRSVRLVYAWNLKSGILKLFSWPLDVNLKFQNKPMFNIG